MSSESTRPAPPRALPGLDQVGAQQPRRPAVDRERRPYTLSPEAREQRRRAAAKPRAQGRKLSAAELDQRRAAPWKTGENARSVLTQTVHPCKPALCPLTDPEERGQCAIKRAVNAMERTIEACPVALVTNEEKRTKLLLAIQSGDPRQVSEMTANLLAGMHELAEGELALLLREGLSVEQPVFDKDGGVVGEVNRVNPRADPALKLLDMLGATAAQQSITPKSSGEKKRDESLDDLASLIRGRVAGREARERELSSGKP